MLTMDMEHTQYLPVTPLVRRFSVTHRRTHCWHINWNPLGSEEGMTPGMRVGSGQHLGS